MKSVKKKSEVCCFHDSLISISEIINTETDYSCTIRE